MAGTRRDWLHKESTRVIRDNQAVYVEDLCVAGLGRTRLAKSVHDAGWSAFTGMLEYKARLYGRTFRKIGRCEPTSQVLSSLRRQGRTQTPACTRVDLRGLRDRTRPGRERSPGT